MPYTAETLGECKDSHILVADFGNSIVDIFGRVEHSLFQSGDNALFFDKDNPFANETDQPSWRLIRKDVFPGSVGESWNTCQSLLPKNASEEVPSARMMTYAIIGHYLNVGERLFGNMRALTSSKTPGLYNDGIDYHYFVGFNPLEGFLFGNCLDRGWNGNNIGLASAQKFY